MKVVFISPHFPYEMPRFTRGLAEVGAQVYGLGDVPLDQIPDDTRRWLTDYIHVPSLGDEESVVRHALSALRRLQPDRIECLWEVGVELAARLRAELGIPGLSPENARDFRDKDRMKARLDKAGLRVPKHHRVVTLADLHAAVEHIGFPLIVKPIDGAGTRDTFKLRHDQDLQDVLPRIRHLPEMIAEEFIEGDEFTFDTVCINGKPVFESIAQYHPNPLQSRTLEWISPAQIVLRDPHIPQLADAVAFGRDVLKAMGMGTGFTHMEWFRKPNGEVVFGEIAARAPGGRLVDQMNYANDFNVYREWARAVCWHTFEQTPQRRYHVAAVFKRARGHGHITRVEGLQEVKRELGAALVVEELLPIGAQRRDWKQTLLSDGVLMARHPDHDTMLRMMDRLVTGVRMFAE